MTLTGGSTRRMLLMVPLVTSFCRGIISTRRTTSTPLPAGCSRSYSNRGRWNLVIEW
jgi:hypothetical protein